MVLEDAEGVTLINTACLEGCTRQRCLRFSVREQTAVASPRCYTGTCRVARQIVPHLISSTQERRDSRFLSLRVHRTALRHPIVSTSNSESVEVGEDASEMSCLREPVRSRRSSPLQVQQAANEEGDVIQRFGHARCLRPRGYG